MQEVATRLAFPSVDALKMCLSRHPYLSTPRYRMTGRRLTRLLVESEIEAIRRRTEWAVKLKSVAPTRNTTRNTTRNSRTAS